MSNRLQLTESPNIEHISAMFAEWNNTLASIEQSSEIHLPNESLHYKVKVKPWANKVISSQYIGVAFGINGLVSVLWLSAWPLAERLKDYEPSGDLTKIPAELQIEIFETVYECFIHYFEELLKSKIKIYKLFFDKPFKSTNYSIKFSAESILADVEHKESFDAIFIPQVKLIPFFQEKIIQLPSVINEFWYEQKSRAYFEIGIASLVMRDLKSLELSDIIFLHEATYFADNIMALRWQSGKRNTIFHASANTVTFKSGELPMDNDEQDVAIADIDDMPVLLSFDLGDELLTFKQVGQIKPGHILNLKKPFTNLVTIRSHNQAIGQGEVIDIEGKVGIRITRLFNKNNK
ncbi:MAG: FliM/FliN family flagellar motor switch protein [bacterium]